MLRAIRLTALVTLLVVPVNLVFGTLLAWCVVHYRFRGRQLLMRLADIPFAMSPVVAGLSYLLLYGSQSPVGRWFEAQQIQVMFAWPGIALATLFITCPYVARYLIPLMEEQGDEEEQAALTLGAGGWQIFRRITLPKIRWGLLYGAMLTSARAAGEFGAVSVVSGTIRGQTLTLPLHVELLHQDYNSVGAFTAAALLTLMALLTLCLRSWLDWRDLRAQGRDVGRDVAIPAGRSAAPPAG
jgi:sulfate transport system permease protein